MEKDNKILLMAVLILFISMLAFNLNFITGKATSNQTYISSNNSYTGNYSQSAVPINNTNSYNYTNQSPTKTNISNSSLINNINNTNSYNYTNQSPTKTNISNSSLINNINNTNSYNYTNQTNFSDNNIERLRNTEERLKETQEELRQTKGVLNRILEWVRRIFGYEPNFE